MITVINVKDLLKYLVGLVITIITVITLTRYFLTEKDRSSLETDVINSANKQIEKISSYSTTYLLDTSFPIIKQTSSDSSIKEESKKQVTSRGISVLKRLIGVELAMIETITDQENINRESSVAVNKQENNTIDLNIKTDLDTEVIKENNIGESYTNTSNKVKIKNKTGFTLTSEMLIPEVGVANKKDILIFHSHTCESYTQSEKFNYQMTGNYRTNNLDYSIARVGNELQQYLNGYGYNVIHDKTYHDYPAYSGSYGRSLETVNNILKNKADLQMVFDLHRDAVGDGTTYGPTVKIGNEVAAQLMFIIGTNGGGLEHPNWQKNLKFAIAIQEKADELYPGLFRPIVLTDSRYNQHVTSAASIIEVGATANTMEECLVSMKYLAKVISQVVK